ncbi:MAG: hypothetical protein ACK6DN_11135, partial [Planctomycetota bacterium]
DFALAAVGRVDQGLNAAVTVGAEPRVRGQRAAGPADEAQLAAGAARRWAGGREAEQLARVARSKILATGVAERGLGTGEQLVGDRIGPGEAALTLGGFQPAGTVLGVEEGLVADLVQTCGERPQAARAKAAATGRERTGRVAERGDVAAGQNVCRPQSPLCHRETSPTLATCACQ